ncbi:glycoside hydrolase family 3 C-terminal domain-containing protein [Melittangium boletus]|uniref:Glycosyl hydrolase n=1 Tax=Melittangium boletus DSM 14713 TaxID=1294270 RepID=A0A250IB51_9BACT|nr:glycoside hydrolase family 3 C-terminal domain-containing protein [Melittangium boletus]ATB28453.1 glycosyl hydrolase [Melittangium boletus DSM 14713]
MAAPSSETKKYRTKAQGLVSQMTVEEKARLLSGNGSWTTHAIERLGIPSIFMADGPHGLRKATGPNTAESVPATCFPTASALASSWNTELLKQVGEALARECQTHDVQLLLGPGINMKRSPLGGRNFEYFSEDPVLAGQLAAAYIQGVQGQGVGTSLKHFAVNNQEHERMVSSSNLDERTLHEIYLPAFEIAIKEAQPWSVMCAYNKVNGVYASENDVLLERILRDEWGFEGFVVSDWGAVSDRVKGVMAGLNLEMPGSGEVNRKKIIAAVEEGRLPVSKLDEVVTGLLTVVLRAKDSHRPGTTYDVEQHQELARKAAGESIILLKNEDALLPLDPRGTTKIAVIGAFAKTPRYQGAGSSQVNPTRQSRAYDELVRLGGGEARFGYAAGYDLEGVTSEQLIEEARKQARHADVAIVFAGLPDSHESEGFDRASLEMPEGHIRLIEAVSEVQSRVVVVLMNGSAITMPWAGKVKAIVEGWLTGQAGGSAIADVLLGQVNPSGKLSETFPLRLEDTPTALEFPGLHQQAHYGEGIFIGYRYYDKRAIQPLFPFGFGLSYTTFAYSDLRLGASSIKETETLSVEVKVKNTGKLAGKEVVQLYVRENKPRVVRPPKELKAFAKVSLEAGQEKTVRFELSRRDFAYFDSAQHDWAVQSGEFEILVGGSSRDLPLKQTVQVQSTRTAPVTLTRDSTVKEFLKHPQGKAVHSRLLEAFLGYSPDNKPPEPPNLTDEERAARKKGEDSTLVFINDMPAYKVVNFTQGRLTDQMLEEMLETVR